MDLENHPPQLSGSIDSLPWTEIDWSLPHDLDFDPSILLNDPAFEAVIRDYPFDFNAPHEAFEDTALQLTLGSSAEVPPSSSMNSSVPNHSVDHTAAIPKPAQSSSAVHNVDATGANHFGFVNTFGDIPAIPEFEDAPAVDVHLTSPAPNESVPSAASSADHTLNLPAAVGSEINTPSSSFLSSAVPFRQPTTHAERNPLLPTQNVRARPPRRQLDSVQARAMNEAKAQKQMLEMHLKQDVLQLLELIDGKISEIAVKHSKTPAYVKSLFSTASNLRRQRATRRIQALVHLKGKEINTSLPVGAKLAAPALRKLVDEDEVLLKLSDDKIELAKKEVEAKKLLSTRGLRPTNASAVKDYSHTSQLMKKEFDALHIRTGAVGFGLLTPGTREDRGVPLWFTAGPNTASFARKHLNMTMWDLMGLLELWANSRHSEKPSTWLELQSQCSASVTSALRYILNDKSVAMNYANYHTAIVAKHHVRLIGLPTSLPEPIKPFDITDRAVLQEFHAALDSGACRWAQMSSEEVQEHAKWMETQRAAGQTVGKKRAERSDKGKKRGARKQAAASAPATKKRRTSSGTKLATKHKTQLPPPPPKSKEFVNDSDESDGDSNSDNDSDNDGNDDE